MSVNYLNNRDLIKNILLSKASYTWYIDGSFKETKYLNYDIIVCGTQEVFDEAKNKFTLQRINARRREKDLNKVYKITDAHYKILSEEDIKEIEGKIVLFNGELTPELEHKAKVGHYNRLRYEEGKKRNYNLDEIQEELDNIDKEDLVIRVYTFEHIPPDNTRKKVKKKIADGYMELNFQPYKHYGYYNGKFQCVAISHLDGDGNINIRHGRINHQLACAFIELCRRYSSRYNWRGYSYVNDMVGQAQLQLSLVGLQFNELFSSNPFSYYTSAIKNAFTVIFNEEKKSQETRDKILMANNQSPSWTKQLEQELSRDEHWDTILDNNNMAASTDDLGEANMVEDFDDLDIDDIDSDGIDDIEDEIQYNKH